MAKTLSDARRELDQEFGQFRDQFGKILEAVQAASNAGPTDDVHGLLERLEDTVKKVRTGGFVGSGAKGHREAREKYLELLAPETSDQAGT